jgi:rhodanese-related sulfurtransferase
MSEIQASVEAIQEMAKRVSPAPVGFSDVTSAADIKARLDWGEPAFTIIDVRDRQSYNEQRIVGAIPAGLEEELNRVRQTLEPNRDIYVYGNSDDDAKRTASQLVESGFERVSIIKDGLSAWTAAGGLMEGCNAKSDEASPNLPNSDSE